jgi:hypothetical protein
MRKESMEEEEEEEEEADQFSSATDSGEVDFW